MSFIKTY